LTALLICFGGVPCTPTPANETGPGNETSGAQFVRGNVNGDTAVELTDAVRIFGFLFLGGAAIDCADAADVDDDGTVLISDGIFLLNHLFLGGPRPPSPSPGACPGFDSTPDTLGCDFGVPAMESLPALRFVPTIANAPGIGRRTRVELPRDAKTEPYQLEAGHPFVLLLEASSNAVTRAGFEFRASANGGTGNPEAIWVVADRALGDPTLEDLAARGAAAGTNLAEYFLRDIELWEDPIYLTQEVGLYLAGDAPLAPSPGLYRFSARVTDTGCAASLEASFELEVLPPSTPRVRAWIEDGPEVTGVPRPHTETTGHPRVRADDSFLLVVEALPNGALPAIAPLAETFSVSSTPTLGETAPDIEAGLGQRFERDPRAPARFFLRRAANELPLTPGSIDFLFGFSSTNAGPLRQESFRLEVETVFGRDVRPILTTLCTGCHEQPSPDKGLELVAPGAPALGLWRNMVNVFAAEPEIPSSAPILVRPLFPERSYMFHKLRGTHLDPNVRGEGERMPLDANNFLSVEQLRLVRSWIEQGAVLEAPP